MPLNTLQDLYIDELKDLYSAENQLIKALPKIAEAATSVELEQAFQHHLEQTKQHAQRIKTIFAELDGSPRGKKCLGMAGLIKEGQELLKDDAETRVLDAGLIGAAQRVEHYEIAGYGTARAHAQQLGYRHHADLLQQTLEEEQAANAKLTQIAENHVNVEAEAEPEGLGE
jgi:ferritin-like metal-binding protein YciE